MNRKLSILAGIALACGAAVDAREARAQAQEASPQAVAGVVTHVDRTSRRVTVLRGDGKEIEFEASDETLRDLAVGDRIEAKKRADTPKR